MIRRFELPSALSLVALALGVFAVGCGGSAVDGGARMDLEPPIAAKVPHVEVRHGQQVNDDYYWLRERDARQVIEYLREENAYTEAVMKPTEPRQQRLYDEMLARIKETDLSVPVKIDDYYYYSRTEEGQQYKIYCRKRGSLDAAEEVLLDQNALAEGQEFCRLGVFEVSPDHNLLAYSVDFEGNELYTVHFKDLRTGELLEERIPGTYYSLEWANDNRTVFYNTVDEAHRPWRLWRHALGSDPANDVQVYQEDDDRYFLGLSKTRSKRYLLLELGSNNTSEVRYLEADRPDGKFRTIHPRQHMLEYYVEHHGDRFLILTNDEAKNFKLVEAPVADPAKRNWKDWLPHRAGVKLDSVDAFEKQLVVIERAEALRRVRVFDLDAGADHYVEFPEPVYTASLERNPEFKTRTVRLNYTSLVTPDSVYDYDMGTRDRTLLKEEEVLGGYDRTRYESKRIWAEAPDGVRVPISLVHKQGIALDGGNPTMLYGYGSYGASINPGFSSERLSLLDRGFVYAIAHIRGGGDMGRQWYDDGKLLAKKNTFTDFIACAEHLIAEKYTRPERLVIRGGSAGGLLVGAVTNMRPDLFGAVVAKVPFVDVINTMFDETIPLTVIEWEEWGDPNKPEYYEYMLSYSPYDNVRPVEYPDMLITAGLNDPRVQYWEPAKWTAKLRQLKQGNGLILLKTNMGAGHAGASGRYDALKELAFEYAFVFDRLGIEG